MKFKILTGCMLLLAAVCSCQSEYDDSDLMSQINNNAQKISNLEQRINNLNQEIVALGTMIDAVQDNVFVQSVNNLGDGYIIVFTDGRTVYLPNGTNGTDGTDGTDGVNGTNGTNGRDASSMGIKEYDGIYYWTITTNGKTEWLLDKNGNKIRVTGADGNDGSSSGAGSDGKDGVSPKVRVSAEGLWEVSYDNGATWTLIYDANGKTMTALGGNKKVNFDTLFPEVNILSMTVEITMMDGTVIILPRITDFYLTFRESSGITIRSGQTVKLYFTVNNPDANTRIECHGSKHLRAKVNYNQGDYGGNIEVKLENRMESYQEFIMIYLCNDVTTITYSYSFMQAY